MIQTDFHCYWTGPLTLHHVLCLSSLVDTQKICNRVHFWTERGDFHKLASFLSESGFSKGQKVVVPHVYDLDAEILGTPLEGKANMIRRIRQERGLQYYSDAFRLLILFKYGGIYFDLDVLFIKDLTPVVTDEAGQLLDFVYEWEITGRCNNAVMGVQAPRRDNLRDLLQTGIKIESFAPWDLFPVEEARKHRFAVLPWQLFDPLWGPHKFVPHCQSFEDFFKGDAGKFVNESHQILLNEAFPGAYTHHWHNSWDVPIEEHPRSLAFQFLKMFRPAVLDRALTRHKHRKKLLLYASLSSVSLSCVVALVTLSFLLKMIGNR